MAWRNPVARDVRKSILNHFGYILWYVYAVNDSLDESCIPGVTQAYGADDIILSVVLNNLAALMSELGQYEAALAHYQRSLTIKQENLPEGHPGIANAHNNIADVLFKLGLLDEAEPRYRAALATQLEAAGTDHPGITMLYVNVTSDIPPLLMPRLTDPASLDILSVLLRAARANVLGVHWCRCGHDSQQSSVCL